ncbi:hypothetical protein BJY52DRAFT_1227579 [Lactarius psammicola]|nr:hypothetical protein BJY52DRAFT_1227579 [Lactarius psammicola]
MTDPAAGYLEKGHFCTCGTVDLQFCPSQSKMTRTTYYQRNKEKLQAYQREYAWRKRAAGRRKVGRVERALLEEKHVQRHNLLTAAEGLLPSSKAAIGLGYKCALIVRSQAADPRRTPDMIEEEEKARDYFEELKDTLQLFCLCGWIDQFQKHVEDFIEEQLAKAASITAVPGTDDEDSTRLHGLRRLVAGAVQEGELIRQPAYAATCAKLDGAIVWHGRGVMAGDANFGLPVQATFASLSHVIYKMPNFEAPLQISNKYPEIV